MSDLINNIKQIKENENRKPNLLFVCEGNALRSKAFEHYFKNYKNDSYNIRSAGTSNGNPYRIRREHLNDTLEWADVVFMMDFRQEMYIRANFPEYTHKLHMIGISDHYDFDEEYGYDEELMKLINFWVYDNDL